jgi:hypothetical protein
MAKVTTAAPRRVPNNPRIAEALAAAGSFAKLSLSVDADVAQQLRVAAVVDHRVSESALAEVALRRFLALPKDEQTKALAGVGRRRKSASAPLR